MRYLARALKFNKFIKLLAIIGLSITYNSISYAQVINSNKPVSKAVSFKIQPYAFKDGSLLTLISPPEWSAVSLNLSKTLINTHDQLTKQFGELSPVNTYVRIMPEKYFFASTGAPDWTNALFYRGEIFIPINKEKAKDIDNLRRSAKHEYVHAVFHALSGGKCPGWLDEGFAQWAEGDENPVLRPALLRYLKHNKPITLSELQGGFTRLPPEKVAAAYAQSLIITLKLKEKFGLKNIRLYLEKLSQGYLSKDAFLSSFGIAESYFEDSMQQNLENWTFSL